MPEPPSTRDRILETSAGLFRRQGAAGTGLKEIVRESGAPWGSLYHYFPDGKDQLVAEALIRAGDHFAAAMARAFVGVEHPSDGVRRYFDAAARRLARSDFADGCPVGTVVLEAASSSERIRTAAAAVFAGWRRVIADALAGFGLPAGPAGELATQFVMCLEGALVLSRAQRDAAPLRQAGTIVAAAVEAAVPRARGRRRG